MAETLMGGGEAPGGEGGDSTSTDTKADEGKTTLTDGVETPKEGEDKSKDTKDAKADEGGDDKAAKDKDKDGEKSDKSKDEVPEKYEFTMPEGTELDPAKVEAFTPLAKDLGLSQENAQKLVDFYANEQKTAYDAQVEAWAGTMKEWTDNAKADKEVGGKAFDENIGIAKSALDAIDPIAEGAKTTPFRDMLDATGTGNHPEQVRFLLRVGKLLKDHDLAFGNAGSSGAEPSAAKKLFPDQK